MENKKSYTEQMKSRSLEFRRKEKNFVLDVYIQMIIDEAVLNHNKSLLEKHIDEALDQKDLEQFHLLAEQYNKIIQILS